MCKQLAAATGLAGFAQYEATSSHIMYCPRYNRHVLAHLNNSLLVVERLEDWPLWAGPLFFLSGEFAGFDELG